MLVLDVLRHVLQDQPIHVGAGAALRFGVLNQLETKSFDPPQNKLGQPKRVGTLPGGCARTGGRE